MSAFAIQMGGEMTDVELMLGLKSGDEDYLEPLLSRHRHVQKSAAAEELTQDVFFSVYRARDRYEPSANFTTWLYRIARNRSMNWIRDNRHDRFSSQLDQAALRMPAVNSLPERQCEAIVPHKFGDMDHVEIAKDFDCSLTAVRALLNRAYASLRRSLVAEASLV